jgi:hypothetical protein
MAPLSKVNPLVEIMPEREACDRAFALACLYSSGQDLVEEMVTSNFLATWEQRMKAFTSRWSRFPCLVRRRGSLFPRFDWALPPDQDKDAFVLEIEEAACQIIGKMSDKEYLARRSVSGTMPRLNRVLEEFGIRHEEYVVPLDVLATIEEKKRKATAKNATAATESKKRKGMAGPKVLAKRVKTSAAIAAPTISATSSAQASASVEGGLQTVPERPGLILF